MSKIVRTTLEASKPTPERRRELKKLAAQPGSEIDLSDIPELDEALWQKAVRNPFYRPVKKQVTLRIDADVLAWLRRKDSKGYQSRLNALLRGVMLREMKTRRKSA
jgi:uncharacterized protein (DUF4415 family)